MNIVEAGLRRVSEDLRLRGLSWALVGGFAVSARSEPRFTRDVDVVVAVADDAAAEALVRSLLGARYRLLASIEQDAQERLAAVRLALEAVGEDDVVVDLLFASSGIETEVAEAADEVEIIPGLVLPVATVGHLIALKLLARDDVTRPLDVADLRALIAVATPSDRSSAREAIALITERGFDRGRNLSAAFDELMTN
jgi:Nucleotidyl transferase AbiEii toxin, Type IV TA system